MERLEASLFFFLISTPFFVPWIFVRAGRFKSWYLAHFFPPLILGRAVYIWPMSIMFLAAPFIGFLPLSPEGKLDVLVKVTWVGIALAIYMVVLTPKWAKPDWQRYLESNYSFWEIQGEFVPEWRKMSRREWSRQLETEAGIEELVQYARHRAKQEEPIG